MKSTKLSNIDELAFLSNHHKHLQKIASNIHDGLSVPVMPARGAHSNGKFLKVIKFSDLVNSWDVSQFLHQSSPTLIALSNKISHMILTGKADSIERMIISICNNHKKKLTQPNLGDGWYRGKMNGMYLGVGHFRWNYQAYELTDNEIKVVKNYFQIK